MHDRSGTTQNRTPATMFAVVGNMSDPPVAAVPADNSRQRTENRLAGLRWALPLAAGFMALAVPTFQGIANVSWSTEQGAHGPIVLALGLWLLVRSWPSMTAHAQPGKPLIGAALLVPSLLIYLIARIVGSIVIESAALYFVFVATLYLFVGARAMRLSWFPIAYLLFVLPPPGSFVAAATQPLRLQLSELAVWILAKFDYPVAQSGLNILVGQYHLEVKAACGGLNSMISLTAMGLFYAHLRQYTSLAYNAFLFVGIIAMAILANLVRIMLLMLISHHLGDAAATGFLHQFAGFTMFAVAMGGVILLDEVASRWWRRPQAALASATT